MGGEFEVGRPPGTPHGAPIGMPLALNLAPLPLESGKRYEWRFTIDQREPRRLALAFSTRSNERSGGPDPTVPASLIRGGANLRHLPVWRPCARPYARAMSEEKQVDVAVVGGGPAGMAAAVAARQAGASVALIDEYAAPGGQIWRRRFDEVGEAAPRSLPARGARALRARSPRRAPTVLAGRSVWGAPEPGVLLLTGATVPRGSGARAIVLATGAYDRPVAFPGWTLPGAMTAGGAQALAKGQGVLPGRRVLLAGAGPFLLPVAAQFAGRWGGRRRRRRGDAPPRLVRRRAADGRYPGAARRLRALPHEGAADRVGARDRARGGRRPRASATIASAAPDWAPRGRGARPSRSTPSAPPTASLPSVDLARALGCELRGTRVAARRRHGDHRSPGVFVAGEATGIGGADLALVEGELAGVAAAAHASTPRTTARGRWRRRPAPASGPSEHARARRPRAACARRRAKLAGFAEHPRATSSTRAPACCARRRPTRSLCRCEDVTAGAVDAAVAGGATTMSALKIVTRCGQGPCQGRVCERLVCARLPEPERFSARAPIRPIALGVLIDVARGSSLSP